jgi:ornithine lipid ester-linked acyl 2-hydroxylase
MSSRTVQGQDDPMSSTGPGVDFDNPMASRRFRLKPPRHLGVKLGRLIGNAIESFIASRSIHPDVAVYDSGTFPWAKRVEKNWRGIRSELDELMSRREAMPSFHEILAEAGTITGDNQWKTFFLLGPGMDCRKNQEQCPKTMRALKEIPDIQTAFFSILSPHKHIPAHRGAFNGVLRYHMGLIVPEPREECRIRIGTQMCRWEEGKSLIFDDTYNHEVWNDTEGFRVVLFVDFVRPMKSPHDWWVKTLLRLAARTPWLREADGKQKLWEKKFYQSKLDPK